MNPLNNNPCTLQRISIDKVKNTIYDKINTTRDMVNIVSELPLVYTSKIDVSHSFFTCNEEIRKKPDPINFAFEKSIHIPKPYNYPYATIINLEKEKFEDMKTLCENYNKKYGK